MHDTTLGIKSTKSLYVYDYMGRRIRKTVYPTVKVSGVYVWSTTPSVDRKFVYDGWNLVEELNALASDAVIRKYTWGLDLSGQSGNTTLAGVHGAGGIGGLMGMQNGSNNYIYFFDANGNVGQVVRASNGTLDAKYEYYPYGGQLAATGSMATTNPFRFSTGYWDGESQLYNCKHRYLRPKLGRWLNRGPAGVAGGLNIYAFVENEPTDASDPFGLDPKPKPYEAPPVKKCGAFMICPRDNIVVPKTEEETRMKMEEAGLDPDHLTGFEVIFLRHGWWDLAKGKAIRVDENGAPSKADQDAYPECDCECANPRKKGGSIRVVQVRQWGRGAGAGTPEFDGAQGWKVRGINGKPPPGMRPHGRTGDDSSFEDGPLNTSRYASNIFRFEVCAICTLENGQETNLGCTGARFDQGDPGTKDYKNRGLGTAGPGVKAIKGGAYDGCFLLTSDEPTKELFTMGIEDWRKR